MNGTPNRNTINSNRVSSGTARPLPYNDLFPPGSNLRPLSNANYFANIAQAGRPLGNSISSQSGPQPSFTSPKNSIPTGSIANESISLGGPRGLGPELGRGPNAVLSNTKNITSFMKAGSGAASLAGGPLGAAGLIAQVSQQIGESTAGFIKADNEKSIKQDFLINAAKPGIASTSSALAIKNEQEAKTTDMYNGAMTGALFGPLGALAGHFLAQFMNSSRESGQFDVGTFQGNRNANDVNLVGSATSRSPEANSNQQDTITNGKPLPTDAT